MDIPKSLKINSCIQEVPGIDEIFKSIPAGIKIRELHLIRSKAKFKLLLNLIDTTSKTKKSYQSGYNLTESKLKFGRIIRNYDKERVVSRPKFIAHKLNCVLICTKYQNKDIWYKHKLILYVPTQNRRGCYENDK